MLAYSSAVRSASPTRKLCSLTGASVSVLSSLVLVSKVEVKVVMFASSFELRYLLLGLKQFYQTGVECIKEL